MSPGRILIVDDEPFVRKTLARVLRRYPLAVAASGEEALELLDGEEPFAVILCDLMMPGLSGMDLHARLRERSPGQEERIVFLTGGAGSDEAALFLSRIATPVLEKPFDFARLRSLVAEMAGELPP